MRFLIDANLPRAVIGVVQSLGHEVEFARDIGLASATDEQIAKHALQYGAALLTRDLDFADINIRLIGTQALSFCVCRRPLWLKRSQRR